MSVIDHFDKPSEPAYARKWDAESARRQFNVSLALIAALGVAAGVLAFSLRGPGPTTSVSASITQPSSAPSPYGSLARF